MSDSFRLPDQTVSLLTEATRRAAAHGVDAETRRAWVRRLVNETSRAPDGSVAHIALVESPTGTRERALEVTLTGGGSQIGPALRVPCAPDPAPQGTPEIEPRDGMEALLEEALAQGRLLQRELVETRRGLASLYTELESHTLSERTATAEAQALARQWQVTFDAVTKAILVCDSAGNVARANRSATRLLGGDLTGQALATLLAERLGMPHAPDLRHPLRAHTIPQAIAERRVCLHIDPIVVDGQWNGAVVRLQDITQQLSMQEELEQRARRLSELDRRKDEYIAMLGHELRNPIATMDAAVQTLKGLDFPDEASGHLLRVLERHGRNVRRLVDDLVNVSRIRQGKVTLRRIPLDLGELVSGVARDLQPRAVVAGHRLSVIVKDGPVRISGDPTRLEQVVTNLIDNAIKYTPTEGQIDVRVWVSPDAQAHITVTDSGVGLDAEHLDAAFDAFVQFGRTADRAEGGMGLGLSLVKSLVQLHGGHVTARSPGRGRGSEFEVILPTRQPERSRPTCSDRAPVREIEGLPLLLVEDNLDLLELTAARLARRGFAVRQASNAAEALALAREHMPQVLVTDIGLPAQDGYELAHALMQVPGGERCVRVALSGYGPPGHIDQQRLFHAYLVKPLDVAQLVECVRFTPQPRARSAPSLAAVEQSGGE